MSDDETITLESIGDLQNFEMGWKHAFVRVRSGIVEFVGPPDAVDAVIAMLPLKDQGVATVTEVCREAGTVSCETEESPE